MASNDRIVPMRVIVCGVHRTGTLSTRTALHNLGFHLCYHMHDVLDNPVRDAPQWINAIESKYGDRRPFTRADWDKLLGGSQAVVDAPGAFFGPELAEAYPDAKVIIQTRDPDKWYQSVVESIYAASVKMPWHRKLAGLVMMLFSDEFRAFIRFRMCSDRYVEPFDYGTDRDGALQWYENIYNEFRTRIPRDRYLEWSVKDGYRPLCEFLEVPVPQVEDPETGELLDAPFPWENDRATFLDSFDKRGAWSLQKTAQSIFAAVGRGTVLAAIGYGTFVLCRTRFGGRL